MGWARPIFLEKRGGPKENFTMIGGGSLCVPEKQVRALKDVHCYDWKTLVEKGELDTLKVPELDKYIEHNKLSKNGKKIDKIK